MDLHFMWIILLSTSIQLTYGQFRSPSIVQHPSDVLVGKDEPATLRCQASGRPKPTITWYKDGKKIKYSSEGTGGRHMVFGSGDLFFLQVLQDSRHDDSGTYWCIARNYVGTVRSNNASLEIAVLAEDFSLSPQDARVAEGDTAMLQCRPPIGSPAPVVTWAKDERQLDPAVNRRYRVSSSGDLIITGARVEDSGSYECSARNAYATRTSSPATLMVSVKPHLISSSGDITSSSGASVELVCRVGGDPQPEVFWRRISPPGALLPIERLAQEENGQVIRIRHVSPEDEGVYTCTADNPVGFVRANTSLIVHSRPVFTTKPKNARVGVGGTARFECSVTGSPQPTTYWTHEGSGLIVGLGQTWSGGRISVNSNNTLNIVGVKEEDTGYYSCVAVGQSGSTIARTYLEVQGVSDMPPPIISIGASNQTLPLGTEAELPCEAKGTPEPLVTWSFKGIPLNTQHSKRHTITPLGTLRINRLKTEDSGLYTCTASSISGRTQWEASLSVYKPTNPNIHFVKIFWDSELPEPPQNLIVLSVNSTQVTMGWSRGRSGSSTIKSHIVQYWSPDLRSQWQEGVTISPPNYIPTPLATTITNLQPNTRYIFTVRSRNKDWISRPSAFTRIITTTISDSMKSENNNNLPPSVQDVRHKLLSQTVRLVSVEAVTSTSLRVTWQMVTDASNLEGVYVRYRSIDNDDYQPFGTLSVESIHFPLRGERGTDLDNSLLHNQLSLSKSSSNIPTVYTINNLKPATKYEVFVVPFFRNIEGQPTSTMRRTTLSSPVFVIPTGLHYRPINDTAVRVAWDPLSSTLAVGGILKGYNIQGLEITKNHAIIHNTTTNSTYVIVPNLRSGITYEFAVRGITSLGLGAPSEVLRFTHDEERVVPTVPNNSIPSPTAANNTYFIIAIVCAAILVGFILFVAVFLIYRKRNSSKCPHYFSKGDTSSSPWSAYSGCWEDGSNVGGISTMRCNDGTTITALNGARYTNGTLTGLSNLRYGEMINGAQYSADGRSQYYMTAADAKNGHPDVLRTSEDLMYEDPEGLKLVSFKTRQTQRCKSPQPYATTPLLMDAVGPIYPPTMGTDVSRLPSNILKNMDYSHNSHSDKGSISSGPVLQFPPPPPPPISGGASSNTTSSGGGSLFFHHLPYHSAGDSSHKTSPLLYPRQNRSKQISPNNTRNNISPGHRINTSSSGGYNHHNNVDPFIQSNNRHGLEDWLTNSSVYPPNVRHSPQSSAMGDAEESDGKSCWSEGTNDRDESTSGSISSVQPDINWTEAVRFMGENERPGDSFKENKNKLEESEVHNKLLGEDSDYYCQINSTTQMHNNSRRNTSKDKNSSSSSKSSKGNTSYSVGRNHGAAKSPIV